MFDQGIWQRIFAANSTDDLKAGFRNSFLIILPVILILGFCGIVAISLGSVDDPSTIIFSLLLGQGGKYLSSVVLILELTLVISSMDTLINAISSLLVIDGSKFIKYSAKITHLNFSRIILVLVSIVVFYIASKGLSVLYMFLLADLLCCAAAIPVFYGMFKDDTNEQVSIMAIFSGLLAGLMLFPDISFQKSILVGLLLDAELFPVWISSALLFWSFVFATFIPLAVIILGRNNNNKFDFRKIKALMTEIKYD